MQKRTSFIGAAIVVSAATSLPAVDVSSKALQYNSDRPGFRLFVYQFDKDVMKVYEDILSGAPITIGFNREQSGLDIFVPLDLRVAETTVSANGSIERRRSYAMIDQFSMCALEITKQVQK